MADGLGQMVTAGITALGAVAVAVVAGATGWWRGLVNARNAEAVARIEAGALVDVAETEADNSGRIAHNILVDARILALETRTDLLAADLAIARQEVAVLQARNALLEERNKMLERQVGFEQQRNEWLEEERQQLTAQVNGPVSDAKSALDTAELELAESSEADDS